MTPDEARSLIASYITGGGDSPDRVKTALQVVVGDADFTSQLRALHGRDAGALSLCHILRERIAEFAGAPRARRIIEWPELMDHLSDCFPCRELYWLHVPSWETAFATAAETVYVLSDPITIERGSRAGLLERGLGPRALPPEPQLATAMEVRSSFDSDDEEDVISPEGPAALRWRLKDTQRGCAIELQLTRRTDELRLTCSVQQDADDAASRGTVRLEVYAGLAIDRRSSPVAAGPLELFADGIPLACGNYVVRVILDPGPGSPKHTWEMPLRVTNESLP